MNIVLNKIDALTQLAELCELKTNPQDYPYSESIKQNIPIYNADTILDNYEKVLPELTNCLYKGEGVFVVKNAVDEKTIDNYNLISNKIIENESDKEKGDHFGENLRVWNLLQKCSEVSPEDYINYYSNEIISLLSRGFLGPFYHLTSQLNVVVPGGKSQDPHRDYPLGNQKSETVVEFPLHTQIMSQYLTIQATVAHSDMPLDSGPVKLLPNSNRYEYGYMHWRKPEFAQYFEDNYVQIPLSKGDIVFTNPAIFHAAGENKTKDFYRSANLIQICSAFNKGMEAVNRSKVCQNIYPTLLDMIGSNSLSENQLDAIISATADGYSFPTNLDIDEPIGEGGFLPLTMQQVFKEALDSRLSIESLRERLDDLDSNKKSY